MGQKRFVRGIQYTIAEYCCPVVPEERGCNHVTAVNYENQGGQICSYRSAFSIGQWRGPDAPIVVLRKKTAISKGILLGGLKFPRPCSFTPKKVRLTELLRWCTNESASRQSHSLGKLDFLARAQATAGIDSSLILRVFYTFVSEPLYTRSIRSTWT